MRLGALAFLLSLPILAACSGDNGFNDLDDIPAPCRSGDLMSLRADDIAIANEILSETVREALFDRDQRDELAAEIREVLSVVREQLPLAADVHAPPADGWQIGLSIEDTAAERIMDGAYTRLGGVLARRTGGEDIDELGERHGLLAVRMRRYEDSPRMSIELCLDDLVNPSPAVAAFEALESVESAYEPSRIGDSPALDMRKRDGKWYVVAREAGGDCPAGCLEEALHFLEVEGDQVDSIPESVAANDPLFVRLVDLARWANDYEWPSPVP